MVLHRDDEVVSLPCRYAAKISVDKWRGAQIVAIGLQPDLVGTRRAELEIQLRVGRNSIQVVGTGGRVGSEVVVRLATLVKVAGG